jgi:2-octaprenyl-6-methoxyphenol hydroxylase
MKNDVVIVGAGPVGLTLALGLARQELSVVLFEARPQGVVQDHRTLVLSEGSARFYRDLGVPLPVDRLTPIKHILVTQKGRFGQTHLSAQDGGASALGYVIRYNDLVRHLESHLMGLAVTRYFDARVEQIKVTGNVAAAHWAGGSEEASLVILADGGQALTEAVFGQPFQHAYAQHALVATVASSERHHNWAHERFTEVGPIALLPYEQRNALVWTGTPHETEERLLWDEKHFLREFQSAFGGRMGVFTDLSPRHYYPLTLKIVKRVAIPHVLCVGNAAQTMHPVAGQGLNLGLRDVATVLQQSDGKASSELGTEEWLKRYSKVRRNDRYFGLGMTHALVTGFSHQWPGLAQARGLGLLAMDGLPWVRRWFCHKMMYGLDKGS